MKESTKKRVEMEARRQKVAELYLRKTKQEDIAKELKISQATVSRDLTWLRRRWTEAAIGDIDARRGRELAELEEMELDCAVQFGVSKDPRLLNTRLRIKERIAKMLGLDAPERKDITTGGKPVSVSIVEVVKDYGEELVPDD